MAVIQARLRDTSRPPTQRELAAALGITVRAAHQHVVALERKNVVMRQGKSSRIGLHPQYELPRGLPVLGRVPAGAPRGSEPEVDHYQDLGELFKQDDLFMLTVHGDSMIDRLIHDGDLVIVRSKAPASDGQVVVASINEEVTIKTLRTQAGQRYLWPENRAANYPSVLLDQEGGRLEGRVLWVLRELR